MQINNANLKAILVEYHFEKLFNESGETDDDKRRYWREQLQPKVEQDVDEMIEDEFRKLQKKEKRKPKSIGQMIVWTTFQFVGSGALGYSINLENAWFFAFSVVILVGVTVWFWLLND